VNKLIWETEYCNLPLLKTDILLQSERYNEFEKRNIVKGPANRIPKLIELVEMLPIDKSLNIEFKQDGWEIIEKVHQILTNSGKKHLIHWFSLSEGINKKLRQFDQTIPTVVSIPNAFKVLFQFHFGLLPFFHLDDAIFGITIEEVFNNRCLLWFF
jgi:hypothetical protein